MNRADCKNLDTFLSDDLSPADASRFTAHLDECENCRDAVDQQRWIDGLLCSPLATDVEAAPSSVTSRVASRATRRRRQIQLTACGLASAAAIVVAAGWTVKLNRQTSDPIGIVNNDVPDAQAHNLAIAAPPRSTFVGGPDVIVMPVESRHPNVTIVRIYPTYQPDFSAQANAQTAASADELVWPLELNGG
jgi:anti-sigma factor RsiW